MKKVRVLCITCDPIILRTVKNWKTFGYEIYIYLNGKHSKKLAEELKDANIFEGPFLGFSKTRNRLLELVPRDNCYNLFLDDTYEIVNFDKFIKGNINSVTIINEENGIRYKRNLLFRNAKFTGNIHETLDRKKDNDSNFIILDKFNFTNKLRTCKRIISDLEKLTYSQRDIYYRFCIFVKLSRFKEAEICYKLLEENVWKRLAKPWLKMLKEHIKEHT